MIDQLIKLGFSDGEAKVYMAALELGETSVVRIAQKAKLERTTVYGFLEGLKKKGLITVSKKQKKTVYTAENPKKLRDGVDEQWKLLETLLPELLSITNAIDQKPKVRFFDTREGIFDIYRETLEYPSQLITIWMSSPWFDDEKFFRDIYMPTRIEKNILIKAIIPKNEETIPFAKDDHASLRETRMTEGDDITADIVLYGNRHIAIVSFKESTAIVLESKPLFDTLRVVFEAHWQFLGLKSSE